MDKRRPEKYLSGVTLRPIIIALIILPCNNYWIFLTEIVRYAGHPTTISLFYNAVFLLLLLVGLNMLLRRFIPRWAFSQGELLTIYIMINLASAMASHDMIQVLVPGMTYPFRFATPENQWASLFLHKIPTWLSVRDKDVLNGFYQGASTLYTKKTLLAWAVPVGMWMLFLMALLWVMLCLTVLLRKQWTEREKLTYPLVHLPMDLSTEKTSFFRNKLFWAGVGVAVAGSPCAVSFNSGVENQRHKYRRVHRQSTLECDRLDPDALLSFWHWSGNAFAP